MKIKHLLKEINEAQHRMFINFIDKRVNIGLLTLLNNKPDLKESEINESNIKGIFIAYSFYKNKSKNREYSDIQFKNKNKSLHKRKVLQFIRVYKKYESFMNVGIIEDNDYIKTDVLQISYLHSYGFSSKCIKEIIKYNGNKELPGNNIIPAFWVRSYILDEDTHRFYWA
jgi:hypothetical protein